MKHLLTSLLAVLTVSNLFFRYIIFKNELQFWHHETQEPNRNNWQLEELRSLKIGGFRTTQLEILIYRERIMIDEN